MCGRFTLSSSPQRLRERFALSAAPDDVTPRYNIAPTQPVLVIPNRRQRLLRPARWGLIPHWASDPGIGNRMINARAETLATRPAFREALELRRCLIPADGFFEWQREGGGRRTPFLIRRRDAEAFAFAGLWALWRSPAGESIASCTIVTTAANAAVSPIHDRMPVILDPQAYDVWLEPAPRPAEAFSRWLVPCPADALRVHRVSALVNSAAHDEPACVEPVVE